MGKAMEVTIEREGASVGAVSNLRLRLRRETRDEHARVDAAFGALALHEREGLALFLTGHALAHDALGDPLDLRGAMVADLRALGVPVPPAGTLAPLAVPALSAAYVLGGAHFGKRQMRRAWARTRDPRVGAAGAYLAAESDRLSWPGTLEALARDTGNEARDLAVVEGARRIFGLFLHALDVSRSAVEERLWTR